MRELALFTGIGGGLLASKLLGWQTICGVEKDSYSRRLLLERQREKCLDLFPIWDDIKTFDGKPWRGQVDIVSGGFPCQPFSRASQSRSRVENLWPEMRRVVREVKPQYVFTENVSREPIEQAAFELFSDGFVVSFSEIESTQLGSPHKRSRWWLAAYADDQEQLVVPINAEKPRLQIAPRQIWPTPGAEVLGDDDGLPYKMDRFRGIGNAQSPQVAALAWLFLTRGIESVVRN